MLLLGVLRDGEQREDWQLELDKPAHLYDARLGRSLGLTKSLSLPKDGPPVRIFAALPEPAGQLAVNAPSSAKAGTDVSVVIRLPHGGGRIVRLETFRPDGQEVVGYRRYTMLGSDKATVTWPLAHNDAKGTWTLRATDVATGIAAEANVEVKP